MSSAKITGMGAVAIVSPAGQEQDGSHACLTSGRLAVMLIPMLPALPPFGAAWLVLALKALAALGFMTAANLVILYAS
jgi:hypothetical protein